MRRRSTTPTGRPPLTRRPPPNATPRCRPHPRRPTRTPSSGAPMWPAKARSISDRSLPSDTVPELEDPLTVEVTSQGDEVVLVLVGELDPHTAPLLRASV